MSVALILQTEKLNAIGHDLYQANAFGDTGRFLGAIRRLSELLRGLNIDPAKLQGLIEKLTGFIGANPELVAIIKRLFGAMTIDQFKGAMADPDGFAASLAFAPEPAVLTSGPAAPVDGGVEAQASPAATAQVQQFSVLCQPFQALSREEFHQAGILDNPGAWMALIQSIIALWKLLKGAGATS